MNQIEKYLQDLKKITNFFESLLEEKKSATTHEEKIAEFTDLRFIAKSNLYPDAINPNLIGNTDEDKIDRAVGVINDFMQIDLTGKKFLDFGCGNGYITSEASRSASIAVGYDIKNQEWEKHIQTNNFQLTTKLPENDFDVILLYDVLDHSDNPVSILKTIKSLRNLNTKIFVRCHPWTSRHATHLYRKLNKAYLHLVFSHKELVSMGLIGDKILEIIDPINTYKKWFNEAGLDIVNESTITQEIDSFFITRPIINKRIKEKGVKFEDMHIQFADFILK